MNTANGITTITAKDLPKLRVDMVGYADDATFGDEFRDVCRVVLVAIDQARDDDEATHAPLEATLNAFVAAGNDELKRCGDMRDLFCQLGDTEDTAIIRSTLTKLLPLLPERYVLLMYLVIVDALMNDAYPVIDFDLANWSPTLFQLN